MDQNYGYSNNTKNGKPSIKLTLSAIVILLIAVVAVAAIVIKKNPDGLDFLDKEMHHRYEISSENKEKDSPVFAIEFNEETKTYKQLLTMDGTDFLMDEGTYSLSGSKITCVSTDTDTEGSKTEQVFVIKDKYIIADNYSYEGKIPEGKTFDVECHYVNKENTETNVTFRKDGTFSYGSSSGLFCNGTYERKGDYIHLNPEDGSSKLSFLIVDGCITNSYYIAVE